MNNVVIFDTVIAMAAAVIHPTFPGTFLLNQCMACGCTACAKCDILRIQKGVFFKN